MCCGESLQQQVREGYLRKGSSQNQKYLNASSSSFSISALLRPTEILQQRLEQSQKQKTGSCGVPFPASKLTLPKMEQLIIHTYTPMVHSCTAHCYCLGWQHCLKPSALLCEQDRQSLPFLLPGDELLLSLTSAEHVCYHLLGLCKENSFFFSQLNIK